MVMVGIWLDAIHAYPETIFIKSFMLVSSLSQGRILYYVPRYALLRCIAIAYTYNLGD